MEDLSFIDHFGGNHGDNNGTLKAVDSGGYVCHISDRVCPFRLLDHCPLLYHAFEYGSQDRLQASIEAPSRAAAIALLRYCYTDSYLPPDSEYAPIRLLLHAQVYKMADDFDVSELQLLAHGNFSVQVDVACSLPIPPQDLLETIRYVYAHFANPQARQQQGLVNTLLNYCVAVFQYHKLGESVEFLQVVKQVPEFRQDLCRTNMDRNFQDECKQLLGNIEISLTRLGAFDIIRLAIDSPEPQAGMRPTMLASRDLPDEMLYDRPDTPRAPAIDLAQAVKNAFRGRYDSDKDDLDEAVSLPVTERSSLVFRPRPSVVALGFETDSSSEDEGFSIVHRPRTLQVVNGSADDLMSSPEVVPSKPMDVLAATGSNYPDDDDWTML